MGKKRKVGRVGAQKIHPKRHDAMKDLTSSLLDPTSRRFVYDEVDDYEDQTDNLALTKARKMMATKSPSREQVLAIDGDSSDDDGDDIDADEGSDDDEMFMEDDIVDERVERVADDRAWGNIKKRYIGTDTSDERIIRQLRGGKEELARLEEEAARKLQQRLAAELQYLPADDLIPQEEEEGKAKEEKVESSLELNLSRLSKSKKLQLLRRESPEFLPLLEDLKEKCKELHEFLGPLMEGVKRGLITSSPACQYVSTKYRLVLNYVSVVSVYMLIKTNQSSARDHPVLGRLAQYRQLLQELAPCDEQLAPHLKNMIPEIKAAVASCKQQTVSKKRRKLKPLQIIRKKSRVAGAGEDKAKLSQLLADVDSSDEERQQEKPVFSQELEASSEEEQEAKARADGTEDTLDPDGRRAITYQIAKNKGLTPSRKKEQRNPRVKYRRKYTLKLKKRKGQVREVRRELRRYEGEVSGIKSHTIKSVKIK